VARASAGLGVDGNAFCHLDYLRKVSKRAYIISCVAPQNWTPVDSKVKSFENFDSKSIILVFCNSPKREAIFCRAQAASREARIYQVCTPSSVLLPYDSLRAMTAARSSRSAKLLVASTPG
jgi:hypothetical protein